MKKKIKEKPTKNSCGSSKRNLHQNRFCMVWNWIYLSVNANHLYNICTITITHIIFFWNLIKQIVSFFANGHVMKANTASSEDMTNKRGKNTGEAFVVYKVRQHSKSDNGRIAAISANHTHTDKLQWLCVCFRCLFFHFSRYFCWRT